MILFLLGFMFMIFGFAWYVVGSMRHYRAGKDYELSTRPGSQPKAVPKFPFGPISDLIKEAEAKGEELFYATFPEERPPPDPPSGYAMDSSPNGIIVSNGVMTTNEWRERYAGIRDVMVLPSSVEYHAVSNPPKMADVGAVDKPHQRFIEGIGIITADSEHNLERACEVAVMEKFRESEAAMRYLDGQIRSAMGVPPHSVPSAKDMAGLKEKRRDAWENCKLYLELLQELNL